MIAIVKSRNVLKHSKPSITYFLIRQEVNLKVSDRNLNKNQKSKPLSIENGS